jgi:hypothetical protein
MMSVRVPESHFWHELLIRGLAHGRDETVVDWRVGFFRSRHDVSKCDGFA